MPTADPLLLDIRGLTAGFRTGRRTRLSVRDASLRVTSGRTTTVLGGDGSGKSTIARAVLRLLPSSARVEDGMIVYKGRDLLRVTDDEMRFLRGHDIGFLTTDLPGMLNPMQTVGYHLAEAAVVQREATFREAEAIALDTLARVGITAPARCARLFPHELDDEQTPLAAIATAIVGEPDLLVADDPTRGMDPTRQAPLLDRLRQLQTATGVALLLFTRDPAVAATLADDLALLDDTGHITEQGPVTRVWPRVLDRAGRG